MDFTGVGRLQLRCTLQLAAHWSPAQLTDCLSRWRLAKQDSRACDGAPAGMSVSDPAQEGDIVFSRRSDARGNSGNHLRSQPTRSLLVRPVMIVVWGRGSLEPDAEVLGPVVERVRDDDLRVPARWHVGRGPAARARGPAEAAPPIPAGGRLASGKLLRRSRGPGQAGLSVPKTRAEGGTGPACRHGPPLGSSVARRAGEGRPSQG